MLPIDGDYSYEKRNCLKAQERSFAQAREPLRSQWFSNILVNGGNCNNGRLNSESSASLLSVFFE